jgi:hypothetical protein
MILDRRQIPPRDGGVREPERLGEYRGDDSQNPQQYQSRRDQNFAAQSHYSLSLN